MTSARDHHHHHHSKKNITSLPTSCSFSFLFLSLLCIGSLFLVFSLFKSSNKPLSSLSPQHHHHNFELKDAAIVETKNTSGPCDYSDGMWIYDPIVKSARYDNTCKEIFKGWNCISSNKSNALELIKWRWKPNYCDLPPFDPVRFLERFRNTKIGIPTLRMLLSM